MIYMNNATQSSQVIQEYQQQLPANLQSLYQKIANERLRIYYMGYILGFVLSLIIIFYNRHMQVFYHSGLVLGIVAVALISIAFRD